MIKKQFNEISIWQNKTFGEATPLSKIAHLQEEVIELKKELIFHDKLDSEMKYPYENLLAKRMEFADLFILLFGAAASDGMTYEDICACIDEKMEINYKRKWGKPQKNGVVHHTTDDIYSNKEEQLYYIRNEGYLGNALMWWGSHNNGYTSDIKKAGKYSYDKAKSICIRPQDSAYECGYIDNLIESHKLIIDSQYVDGDSRMWGPNK